MTKQKSKTVGNSRSKSGCASATGSARTLARELYEVGKASAERADKTNILRKCKWSEINEIQRAGWLAIARHVIEKLKAQND